MDVSGWVWGVTIAVLVGVLAVDVFVIGRRPHEPSMRECAIAISIFIGLAVVFGIGVFVFAGAAVRRGVLRRLADGVLACRSTTCSSSSSSWQVRGAEEYQQTALLSASSWRSSCAGSSSPSARRDQQLQLGLLHLRRLPRLHRRQAGDAGRAERRRTTRRTAAQVGRAAVPATRSGTASSCSPGRTASGVITPMSSSSWPSAPPTCCSRWTRSRRSTGSPRSPTSCSPRTSSR
jgi:hypothetical protein